MARGLGRPIIPAGTSILIPFEDDGIPVHPRADFASTPWTPTSLRRISRALRRLSRALIPGAERRARIGGDHVRPRGPS